MKVLLVNIPRRDVSKSGKQISAVPPLGLAYIASSLKAKCTVKLLDAFALGLSNSDVVDICQEEHPYIVGMTILTPWVADALDLTQLIKAKIPNILIIAGGPHPTVMWKETIEKGIADICVIGEGETTAVALIEAITNKVALDGVSGIALKVDGVVKANPRSAFIDNLDLLPFPDWDSLPIERYWDPLVTKKNYARIFASRGCPHSCVFCDQKNVHGRKIRMRSPGNIVDEIEYLVLKKGVRDVDINDSEFTFHKDWVKSICEEILNRKLTFTWRCNGRADSVEMDTLLLMKKAGSRLISIGVESGDDDVLKRIRKGETKAEIRRGCSLIKKAGITLDASFMLGLPFDTLDSMNKTIDFAKELDPHYAHFAIAIPYPGTEFYQIALEEGFPIPQDWTKFSFYGSALYAPPGLSTNEVKAAYAKAVKGFYLRPKYLVKQLGSIRSFTSLKMIIRGGINVLKRI